MSARWIAARARNWARIMLVGIAGLALFFTMAPLQAHAADATGSVSGTITSSDHPGVGLAGMWVYLSSTDWESNPWGNSVASGADGAFSFTGVPNGTYRLRTYPSGYYLTTYRGTDGATTDFMEAATLTVSGGALGNQDVEAVAGAIVAGDVTGSGVQLPVSADIIAEQKKDGIWQIAAWASYSTYFGKYQIVVPPGITRLKYSASGFRDEYFENAVNAADATLLTLSAGESHTINVDLAPGPKISGTVFSDSAPVFNAEVCARPVDDYYASQCAWTDSSGNYSIGSGLEAGPYYVQTSYDGYLNTYYAASGSVADRNQAGVVDLAATLQPAGIDLHLIEGAIVSGTVTRSTGSVANAIVCDNSGEHPCAHTDVSGHYTLRVAPGTVILHATFDGGNQDDYFAFSGDSAELTLVDGKTYPNTVIALNEGTGLTGTVARSYGVSVAVNVYRIDAGRSTFVGDHWLDSERSTFAFRDLEPGTYVVRFRADGHEGACVGGAACTPITVTQGAITDIGTATMTPFEPGSVAGKVLDSSGTPLAGVSVGVDINGVSQTVSTDEQGDYLLTDLPSKLNHQLTFSLAGYASATRSVEPLPGLTTKLMAVHLLDTGTVSGTLVVPAGGDPTAVSLYLDGPGYYSATPGADGSYNFTNVVPGRYHLRASSFDASILSGWYPGVRLSDDAPRIVVPEGSPVTLDPFALRAPASISGTLSDGAGPVGGNVRLYDDDGALIDSTFVSSGTFDFDDLWPGRYTIRAGTGSTALRTTWLGNVTSMAQADRIDLAEGEVSSGNAITMVAREGGSVSGRVLAHDGTTGVSDVEVATEDQYATTSADGSFTTGFFPEGTYPVSLDVNGVSVCGSELALKCDPPALVVGAGGASDVTFTLPPLGSITGIITGPAGAVSGADVWLADAEGEAIASVESDSGTFTLSGIPYGTYTITVEANGLAPSSTAIVVDGIETHDASLGARHRISGTVLVEGYAEWLRVGLVDSVSGDEVDGIEFEEVEPGAIPYSFDNVIDGDQYWVRVVADNDREDWYANADTPLSATKVSAHGADVTGIDLALAAPDAWYTVSGTLAVPAGTTIDEGFEVCFDTPDHDDGSGFGDCTTPAPNGSYSLTLPAATYYVSASAPAARGLVSSKKTVEIIDDITVHLTMALGGSLTGRLVDNHGAGVVGEVTVTDGVSQFWSDTDEFGYWLVNAIPVGNVTVKASAGGFADFVSSAPHLITAGGITDAGNQELGAAGNLRIGIASVSGVGSTEVTAVVTTADGQTELARKAVWAGGDPEDEDNEITGLPAGQIKVRFFGPKVKAEWWKDATDASMATEVTIVNDVTKTIRPVLGAADPLPPATISGVIENASGHVGTIRLTAVDQDYQRAVVEVTSVDGSYTLQLAPGTYQFHASICVGLWMGPSGCLGKSVTAWLGGTSGENADRIAVNSGDALDSVNLTLVNPLRSFVVGTPVIGGLAKVGQTLTASPGAWTPSNGTFTFRWFRGTTTVGTGRTYTVKPADLGQPVSLEVRCSKSGYQRVTSAPVASAIIEKGTLVSAKPTIAGTVKVGAKLTATPGTWTPGTVLSYRWAVGGLGVGTASTYTPIAADLGKKITLSITGTLAGYNSVTQLSAESVGVGLGTLTSGTVTIAGTGVVGQTLTAKPGTWSSGTTLRYQWKRGAVAITGATGATYRLVTADAGTTVTVVVTGSKAGYSSVVKTSAGLAVARLTMKAGTVSIKGVSYTVGVALSAVPGGWPTGAVLSYQWRRNGVAIAGATASTYKPVAADVGTKLSVVVKAAMGGYNPAQTVSVAVGPVMAALTKGTVTVSGTAKVASTLTAKLAGWAPTGTTATFQWLRSGAVITGATKSTYKLSQADKGKTIQVRVTVSKAGYTSVVALSTATASVK